MLYYKARAQTVYLDTLYSFNYFTTGMWQNGSCLQLNDTIYVISTNALGPNSMNFNIYLFAINLKGDTLWATPSNSASIGNAGCLKSNFDNYKNILTSGSIHIDSIPDSQEAIMFKMNSSGNIEWFKTYGIAQYSDYQGVYGMVPIATFDNHYVCLAQLGIDSVSSDFLLIKTDTTGNEESRWQYGTPKYNWPIAGIQTLDSGYLIAGATTFADTMSYYTFSIYIVKVDKNGNQLWDTIYTAPRDTNGFLLDDAVANDALEASNGYIICGSRYARQNTVWPYVPDAYQQGWMAELNKQDGSIIWEQNLGIDSAIYQELYKITKTNDGGYAACGGFNYAADVTGGSLIVKTDSLGNPMWSRIYYYANDDTIETDFYNILQIPGNGYLLEGYAEPNNDPGYPWVVITDSMGCLIPGCDTLNATDIKALPGDIAGVAVYPDPASNVAYILIKSDENINDLSFKIYDLNGQLIATKTHALTDVTYLLNTSTYAKGTYLVEVMSGGKVVASKEAGEGMSVIADL